MRTPFFIISILLSCTPIVAQSITYKGNIATPTPSEAIITLKNLQDSTQIYSSATQAHYFIFEKIPVGNYQRCILYNAEQECKNIELHTDKEEKISLESPKEIQEVVIKNTKPFLSNKNGTLQVNVENSPILSSGNVFDAMMKLPFVQYQHSSNTFTIKGKQGVLVMMDGQRIYMQSNELSEYLKSFPASDIETIEVITNPSSKYDASGNAGIINIKTKKLKRKGYSLGTSLSYTQAKYHTYNAGIKAQYNTQNSQYLLQYNHALDNDFEDANTHQAFKNVYSHQDTYAKIRGKSNTIRTLYERKINNSTLNAHATFSMYNEKIGQNTALDFYNPLSNAKYLSVISTQNSKNTRYDFHAGISYTLKKSSSEFSLKSNYIHYDIDNFSLLSSTEKPSLYTYPDLKNTSPNKIHLFVSQADYEHQLNENHKIETGTKWIHQSLNNANIFFQNTGNTWQNDTQKSNDYQYKESILSGYLQYHGSISQFDFTIGNRIEYAPSQGINIKNNYTLNRKQTHLFPYLNIAIDLSENHNLNFSFNRRINRVPFSELMPFEYYIDPFTKIVGNPQLVPNLSNSVELQYIFKQNYLFSASYHSSKNEIHQTVIQNNDDNSVILSPSNIHSVKTFTLNSNITYEPFQWWNLNFNGNFYHISIQSDTPKISRQNIAGQFVLSNIFSLPNKWKLELTSDYTTPTIDGAYKTDGLFMLNAGVSKNFLNNKMKIALVGNDILKTYKIKNTSIIQNQVSSTLQNIGTHWIRLSLTYKLSKGIEKKTKDIDTEVEQLKSRVH